MNTITEEQLSSVAGLSINEDRMAAYLQGKLGGEVAISVHVVRVQDEFGRPLNLAGSLIAIETSSTISSRLAGGSLLVGSFASRCIC